MQRLYKGSGSRIFVFWRYLLAKQGFDTPRSTQHLLSADFILGILIAQEENLVKLKVAIVDKLNDRNPVSQFT
ncbi:hypothetical protein Cylst_4087 [Cylindrospermum stagnale PCC 7417]|uniref:Uncharacterized protein n=1 Tax=Cylindrospermum stagnale PCC 7417 TaxID=56107 RepID=K9X294_9NOST|nr:hypothetical protein [Cylindrospermum stagnale]AFZ26194.1 hypothetical protein Cylst_4087 [Cylindrospermum stagnale PCC 7417]